MLQSNRNRRAKCRFQIEQELRYKIMNRRSRVIQTGTATCLNISSSGFWFDTPNLRPKLSVEVSIDWPVMLHDTRPMQLTITGSVVRSNNHGTAVAISRYEFRTRASRTFKVVTFPGPTAKLA